MRKINLLSTLLLAMCSLTVNSQTVLNTASATYDEAQPLRLMNWDDMVSMGWQDKTWSADAFLKSGASHGSNDSYIQFPITADFNNNVIQGSANNVDFAWIVPDMFATTKEGSLLELEGYYSDGGSDDEGNIQTSLNGRIWLVSNSNWSGHPSKSGSLYNGAEEIRQYINDNRIENGNMVFAPGKLRIRINDEILSKLQTYGLGITGDGVTFNGARIIDEGAVFPAQNETDDSKKALTVPVRANNGNWWQNAIVLDKALFDNVTPGMAVHVYTSKVPTATENPYTGYPTVGDEEKSGAENTSQVYFQSFKGTTQSPGNGDDRYIDRAWDYMTSDAYFVLSQEDIDNIKKADVTQVIINGGTIRKISIDPVWGNKMTYSVSELRQSFPVGQYVEEKDDNMSYRVWLDNIRGLQPKAGDVIRVGLTAFETVGNSDTDEDKKLKDSKIGIDFWGENTTFSGGGEQEEDTANFIGKKYFDAPSPSYEYTLTQEDVDRINDNTWRWLVLKPTGLTVTNVWLVRNTTPSERVIVLDEDNTVGTLNEADNVTVRLKRKFTKGRWSTIILPFSLSKEQVDEVFGPNCDLAYFQRTDFNNDATETDYEGNQYKILSMYSIHELKANAPMVIRINDDDYIKDEYVFHNVDVKLNSDGTWGGYGSGGGYESGPYVAMGTYGKIPALPKYAIFLTTKANKHHNNEMRQDFYWVGDKAISSGKPVSMKGFRWYMYFSNKSRTHITPSFYDEKFADSTPSTSAKAAVLYIDGKNINDTETTGITKIEGNTSSNDVTAVYNLNGQRVATSLQSRRLPTGIYIVGGKKVFIK